MWFELADEFFGPRAARLEAMMSNYPSGLLVQFESLLHDTHATMSGVLRTDDGGPGIPGQQR